ncbi:MAG TPA: hypothetical protein PLD27_13295, partial [bacterium]|nr:hypothetical protein [bacterium]
MKKISLILMICLFSFINILFATSTDTAPFQTLFDTFAYYCNNLNETGLYSLFATDFLDNGEDSNSFIGMISNEILSMLGDDNKISFVVNSAELLSDTLAEVTFTMYIKQTSDSAIIMMEEADEPFTFKLINEWKMYGNQNAFEANVYTEIVSNENIKKLWFKVQNYEDTQKLFIMGDLYDSSQIEYVSVDGVGNLYFRLDGNYQECDTYQIISGDIPSDGTEYTFRLKLKDNQTIYQAKAKYRRGIQTQLTITSPVANSIGDTSGHFAWNLENGETNLIDWVYLSIWGQVFIGEINLRKEEGDTLTSYDTTINYPAATAYTFYVTVSDKYGNRSTNRIIFYPLPGDCTITANYTFTTQSTYTASLNGIKTYLLLTTWQDAQEIISDSKSYTLSLSSETTTNIFQDTFTQLFTGWYNLKAYLDLNNNGRYDSGEPEFMAQGTQLTSETKVATVDILYNFSPMTFIQISNLQINGGAPYTKDTTVILQFDVSISNTYLMDTLYYRVIDDKETGSWTVYTGGSVNWNLSSSEGIKYLTLEVKDWFGNSTSFPAKTIYYNTDTSVVVNVVEVD